MSSTYRVLCLSHDPATIAADGDWNRAEMAEAAIAAGIDNHEQCDLLIGAYSYPLYKLGCPPSNGDRRQHQHRCNAHSSTQWMDLGWLRLLALAQEQPAGSALLRAAGDRAAGCWPVQRLGRLRAELGLGEAPEPVPCRRSPCLAPGCGDGCGYRGETPTVPPPCHINHDRPGQPRPEPLTARGEPRCQSQHRPEGGALVQCARAVHPVDAHTSYDSTVPLSERTGDLTWHVWNDEHEATGRG